MPRPTTDADRIAERRSRVAAAYLRGRTQRDIAAEVRVDQGTVCRDLEAVRSEWLRSAVRDYDARKAEELAKIDALEAESWLAWDRSKADHERLVTETKTGGKDGGHTREVTQVDGRLPASAYLNSIQWCIGQRCKILGLEAPKVHKVDAAVRHDHVDVVAIISNPVAAELACRLFEQIAARPDESGGTGALRERGALDAGPPPQPPQPQTA